MMKQLLPYPGSWKGLNIVSIKFGIEREDRKESNAGEGGRVRGRDRLRIRDRERYFFILKHPLLC